MDIIKAYAVNNLCYIAAKKMTPKGILIHSTGANNPTLKRYVDCPDVVGKNLYGNHWNAAKPGGKKVCVHAFIGYDKNQEVRIAQILPLDICCWGVGKGRKGSYNYDPPHIQLEICEDSLKDGNYYKKAFELAAEYCASLCKKYDLAVTQIRSHKEAHKEGYGSNHGDPEYWMSNFGETMDDFRSQVSVLLNGNGEKTGSGKGGNTVVKVPTMAISDGSLVSIAKNGVYYNGKAIPAWVKSQKWYVKGTPKGDRVVIDENEKGTHFICSPISSKYLSVDQSDSDVL